MREKNYLVISSVIFGIVAILHLWRAVSGLPLILGVWEAPILLSWVAFVIAGFMSYFGFTLLRKKK